MSHFSSNVQRPILEINQTCVSKFRTTLLCYINRNSGKNRIGSSKEPQHQYANPMRIGEVMQGHPSGNVFFFNRNIVVTFSQSTCNQPAQLGGRFYTLKLRNPQSIFKNADNNDCRIFPYGCCQLVTRSHL